MAPEHAFAQPFIQDITFYFFDIDTPVTADFILLFSNFSMEQ